MVKKYKTIILTGKAKEDFEFWYWNDWFEDKERNYYKSEQEAFDNLKKTDKVFLNAIIIEWFDSVGIYIEIIRNEGYFEYIVDEDWDYGFELRQEAITQAIKKANETYNAMFEN